MSRPVFDGRSAMLHGAFWALAMRWSIKLLGVLSTLLLARLLAPADYGLVAMAMLVVGLAAAFSDFGVSTSLLREASLDQDDIDSAWTVSVLQLSFLAIVLAIVAPLAAQFFNEPKVQEILWLIAACQLLTSTGSIGIVLARREFNFSLEFRYHTTIKLVSVVVTLVAAWFLRDYRALALGIACSYLLGWILGYVMHPYRPRWNTSRLLKLWRFGRWVLLAGVGGFVTRRCDELLAGRFGQSEGLGLYAMGSELGQIVTAEVGPAMLKAMLPVLARIEGLARQRQAVLKAMSAVNALTLPAGVGLALVSAEVVQVFLGPPWAQAAEYLLYFALLGAVQVMMSPVSQLVTVLGNSKALANLVWKEFAAFLLLSVALVSAMGLPGLALARLLAAGVALLMNMQLGERQAGFRFADYAHALTRPMVACLIMAACVLAVHEASDGQSDFTRLWVQSACGALSYTLSLLGLWLLAGRPDGLERIVGDGMRVVIGKLARRGD